MPGISPEIKDGASSVTSFTVPQEPKLSRRKYPAKFKAQVALEAIKGQKTLKQLSAEFGVNPNSIEFWKRELQSRLPTLFDDHMLKFRKTSRELQLERQLRQLQMKLIWLKNYHRPRR